MDIVIPSGQNLLLFAGAALVLLLIPGPAVLYVVGALGLTRTQGRDRLGVRHSYRDAHSHPGRGAGLVRRWSCPRHSRSIS